jgi:hypothetical protein
MNLREKLIENGIKNLKEFGYPSVDRENIFTDLIYSKFFISMLKDNLGQAGIAVGDTIHGLLKEIEKAG